MKNKGELEKMEDLNVIGPRREHLHEAEDDSANVVGGQGHVCFALVVCEDVCLHVHLGWRQTRARDDVLTAVRSSCAGSRACQRSVCVCVHRCARQQRKLRPDGGRPHAQAAAEAAAGWRSAACLEAARKSSLDDVLGSPTRSSPALGLTVTMNFPH